jgi:hypothetical protein
MKVNNFLLNFTINSKNICFLYKKTLIERIKGIAIALILFTGTLFATFKMLLNISISIITFDQIKRVVPCICLSNIKSNYHTVKEIFNWFMEIGKLTVINPNKIFKENISPADVLYTITRVVLDVPPFEYLMV